jgi:hypothetical protein
VATDPQQLLVALAGTTGLGQRIADDTQNTAIGQRLGQQQIAQNDYQAQQQQQQQASAEQFNRDVLAYNQNPSPQALSALAMRYPQQAQNFTAAAKLKDDAQRNADLTSYGQIYNAASNGRKDLVLQQLQQRQTAMRAAGQDTSNIDDAIQQLNTGGDDALKNVKGIALAQIYGHDPDGFTKAFNLNDDGAHFKSTGDNAIYDDRTGELVRQGVSKPEYKIVKRSDGGEDIVQVGGGGQASTAGGAGGGSAGPVSGRTTGGWTPRTRNGGDNPDAAVDSKIAGAAKALGVDPDADISKQSPMQIAQAMTLSEGGKGSLADRNNNPANLRNGDGSYKKFPTKEAGLAAAAALVARKLARGQTSVRTMIEGLPIGGSAPSTSGGAAGSGQVVYKGQGNAPAAPDDVTGPAYKAYLSPGRANLVQAVIDGRAPAPRPGSKYGEALAEDIARVDPTADATTLPIRQQTRKEYSAAGKQGQAMQAYNRFAAHLNSAWALHQQLGGANLGPLSSLGASISQSFSPGLVAKYNTEIEGLQGEFQKLTKLGVANEGEANRLVANARPNQSADGRGGALKGMAELVAGAYQPAVQGWHAAFPNRPLPIDVSPGAKSVINNVLHGGKSPLPTGSNGAPIGNARGFTPHGAATPARTATGPNGQKLGLIGGKWVSIQ